MVDLSKFTSRKKILNEVIFLSYGQVYCQNFVLYFQKYFMGKEKTINFLIILCISYENNVKIFLKQFLNNYPIYTPTNFFFKKKCFPTRSTTYLWCHLLMQPTCRLMNQAVSCFSSLQLQGANFNAMFVLSLHLFQRLLSSLLSFFFTYLIFNFMLSK